MLDLLFTEIIHGYLDTAASRLAGIPSAADCALMKMDAEDDEKDPRITIIASELGENRSRQIAIVAVCRGTATRAVTDPWMNAVRDRLADQSALFQYLAALPVSKRTGYQIEKITPPNAAKVQRDPMASIETGIGVIIHVTI